MKIKEEFIHMEILNEPLMFNFFEIKIKYKKVIKSTYFERLK